MFYPRPWFLWFLVGLVMSLYFTYLDTIYSVSMSSNTWFDSEGKLVRLILAERLGV